MVPKRKKPTPEKAILLSVSQTAKLLGMSEMFLYHNVKTLPHFKVGNRIKFSAEELLAFWRITPQ